VHPWNVASRIKALTCLPVRRNAYICMD
jgi:hypothetical protein